MTSINKIILFTVTVLLALHSLGTHSETSPKVSEAEYLGVYDYGEENVNKDNVDKFLYRFKIDGKQRLFLIDSGEADEDGSYSYPVQNRLKEGYKYNITIDNRTVTAAEEITDETDTYMPPVQGTAGERTLENFLKTALMPVGTTLYIYGGGWDWQDEGSAISTRTIGVSPDWVRFFSENDENYTYSQVDGDASKTDPKNSYYPHGGYNEYYYAGLDCSGYLGWVLYNTFETESGNDGWVGGSTGFAKRLAARELGEWTQDIMMPDGINGYEMKPGDIMSINGHVWISLGTCDDGSVVLVHSTPSKSRTQQPGGGVQISAIGYSYDCEAYRLADRYMSEYYPEWYNRYQTFLCSPAVYFTFTGENAGRFTWYTESAENGITDPDGLQEKSPSEVLEILFEGSTPVSQ